MGHSSRSETAFRFRREAAIDARLYEHEPQTGSQGALGLADGFAVSFSGPLRIISGILLAFMSTFLFAFLVVDFALNDFADVALTIGVVPLLLVGTWYSFSQASDELDSTLELKG